jgi:hypothetical protein
MLNWLFSSKQEEPATSEIGADDPKSKNFNFNTFFKKHAPIGYYHLHKDDPDRDSFIEGLKDKDYSAYHSFRPSAPKPPALGTKDLKGIRGWLEDPEEDIDPMTRATYHLLLNKYGSGKSPTGFSQRYDKYYAPFLAGLSNTSKKDMIEPQYLRSTPFDDQDTIMNKHRYNLKLNKYSTIDPFLTAASHGLGLISAATGGVPGLIGGYALKNGIPLMWHIAKQRLADQASRRSRWDNFYDSVRKSASNL